MLKVGCYLTSYWSSFPISPTLPSAKQQVLMPVFPWVYLGLCCRHNAMPRWHEGRSGYEYSKYADEKCCAGHTTPEWRSHVEVCLTPILGFEKHISEDPGRGSSVGVNSYLKLWPKIWAAGRRYFIIINVRMATTYECLLLAKCCGKSFLCIDSSKSQNQLLFLHI